MEDLRVASLCSTRSIRWHARGIVVMVGVQYILLLYRELSSIEIALRLYPNKHGNQAYIAADDHQKWHLDSRPGMHCG